MRERLIPVHCCCEPGKRLGYLPVHEGDAYAQYGSTAVAFLRPRPATPGGLGEAAGLAEEVQTVRLRLRPLALGRGLSIVAFDSGHQPLDVLRTLPGWRDA